MDKENFVHLIEERADSLYRVAWAILGNNADVADALQETALRAWQHRFSLRSQHHFGTWVTRICINVWDVICQGKIYLLLKLLSHNTHNSMKNSKRDSHVLSLLPYRV